jgi:protein gp37
MSASTSIQWTDRTWNPVRGCSRVSAGCDNCYAMRQAHRFNTPSKRSPYHGLTTIRRGKVDWAGVARFIPEQLGAPLKWRKPARVFVNSMSDLFHPSLSNEEIAAVFGVMAACPQHTFQVLTKQPKRAAEWFKWAEAQPTHLHTLPSAPKLVCAIKAQDVLGAHWTVPNAAQWPLTNVWLGVSVEDQKTADDRVSLLLELPAAIRFVSYEPALGPVDFDLGRCDTHDREFVAFDGDSERGEYCSECAADGFSGELSHGHWLDPSDEDGPLNGGINWVIVGGESGPGARPCALEWLERIVGQCGTARVPVFVKQLGASVVSELRACETDEEAKRDFGFDSRWLWRAGLKDRKGGDPSEWPEALRVRQFPSVLAANEAGK